jgi:hypothetical protein
MDRLLPRSGGVFRCQSESFTAIRYNAVYLCNYAFDCHHTDSFITLRA